MDRPTFEMLGVDFRYRGGARDAVHDANLSIPTARHTAILGPNGSGKSTLLRLLLGILRPRRGSVRLWNRQVSEWPRRDFARKVGVVSQEQPPDLPLSVRTFVEFGRNPHLKPWAGLQRQDREAVARALVRTELVELADRSISGLSGGELQRAKLARALAQEPEILLLDEPTAHLDLGHELRFFHLIRELVDREEITVVSVTHNLHLASRYADLLVLLRQGSITALGSVREVLQPAAVGRAFGWPVKVIDLGPLGVQVVPLAPEQDTPDRGKDSYGKLG